MDQTLLLVVGISEGRNFPNRHGYQLIVETRFQGEVLQSDPVDHVIQPIINTELAWSLSKKCLHQHRLQRTPIKLQLYAVSSHHGNTQQGDSIGYIMLDLRMATPKGHAQWYGLQNCQYSQQRPQVYVTMTTEQDHMSSNQGKDTSVSLGVNNAIMTLQLDEEQGYYTLGEVTMDTAVYILSVTITSARRLSQLGGSYHGDQVSEKQPAYYFYYSLLGNDITNAAFYSLLTPSFRPERASIRVKSDRSTLNTFLASLADIKVHLYAGKSLLAVAKIPLRSLATVTMITDEYPLTAEETNVTMDTCPLVAVTVAITTESLSLPDDNKPLPWATAINSDDEDDDKSSKSSHSNSSHSNSAESARRSLSEQFNMVTMETTNQQSSKCSSPTTPIVISQAPSLTSSHIQTVTSGQDTKELPATVLTSQKAPISTNQDNFSNPTNHTVVSNLNVPNEVATDHSPATHTDAGSNQTELPHHFCVAVDVRSLRLLVDHMSNSQLTGRYGYPFFGTSQSVILPTIKPLPYVECLFDQSYCAFDFATPRGVLTTQLNSVPLVIELLENNSGVVAMATIMMSGLLTQPAQTLSGGVHRQYYDSKVAVVASHDNKLIGELHVIISLEDHGCVSDQTIRSCDPALKSCDPAMKACDHNTKPVPQTIRDDPEYHVAMEMEVWRAEQEELFMKQLQQKEEDHLRLLAEEWRQREKQRDHMIQTKVAAYQKLQEQLQQSLDHVIQQRQQLEAWQQELHKLESSLQEERRNLTLRVEDVSNKLEQEYQHKLTMEQLHSQELQSQVTKLTNQIAESDRILANRTAELEAHLQSTSMATGGVSNDAKLQAQVNMLLLEKSQLEHKLLSANKSRQHYKEQWSHALRELAHMRQQEASASRQRLRQQEQELDHMRQQLLSHSQHQVLSDELDKLKSETERLQQQLSKRKDQSSPGQPVTKATDTDITRWIEERDILLQTGLYSSDDPTISRLDHQIRTAMAAKKQLVTS